MIAVSNKLSIQILDNNTGIRFRTFTFVSYMKIAGVDFEHAENSDL